MINPFKKHYKIVEYLDRETPYYMVQYGNRMFGYEFLGRYSLWHCKENGQEAISIQEAKNLIEEREIKILKEKLNKSIARTICHVQFP